MCVRVRVCVRVFVCACVRVRVCACVRACVCVRYASFVVCLETTDVSQNRIVKKKNSATNLTERQTHHARQK